MRKLIAAAVVGSSLCLSGCVISVGGDGDGNYGHHADWQDQEQKNRRAIAKLEPELSLQDIAKRLGTPDFNEYYEKDGDKFQILYFRTQRISGDGVTTKDECTPLIFKNGLLAGWGDTANAIIKSH